MANDEGRLELDALAELFQALVFKYSGQNRKTENWDFTDFLRF
jgi:hypothetical protein